MDQLDIYSILGGAAVPAGVHMATSSAAPLMIRADPAKESFREVFLRESEAQAREHAAAIEAITNNAPLATSASAAAAFLASSAAAAGAGGSLLEDDAPALRLRGAGAGVAGVAAPSAFAYPATPAFYGLGRTQQPGSGARRSRSAFPQSGAAAGDEDDADADILAAPRRIREEERAAAAAAKAARDREMSAEERSRRWRGDVE